MTSLRQRIRMAIPTNSFVRGVIALSSGAVGAQAIVIAVSPVLTRLYTPEMFGVVSIFVGISSVLGILATWRYEIAIPQAKDDQAAANLAVLCLALSVVMFVLSGVIIFLFHDAIAHIFHLEEIAEFLWLIPLFIFSIGVYQLLSFWNYRQRQFGSVASSTISKNIGMVGVQILLYPLGALALLVGQLFGQFLAAILLLRHSLALFRTTISAQVIRYNIWRFRKYPLFSSWSGVTGQAAQQAPMLMFAVLFSPVEAGLYSLAYRMIGLPGSLVGTAVANVFLPHAADAYREGQLGGLLTKMHAVLAQLAMPVAAMLAVVAPEMFVLVFGSQWREAGHYVQWLTIMLYANFIYSPISRSFGIMDRQDAGLWLHIGLLIVSVASIWVGASFYQNALVAVALYSGACTVLYVLALGWIHRKAGSPVLALLSPVVSSALRTIPVVIPVLLATVLPMPLWCVLLLGPLVVVFAVLYYKPLL